MRPCRVSEVMREGGDTVGHIVPLSLARTYMERFSLPFLPVLDGGRVVGVLLLDDVEVLERAGVDLRSRLVGDAMKSAPTFGPDAAVAEVARVLSSCGAPCAIIVEAGRVTGVVAPADALSSLLSLEHAVASAH